MTDFNPNTPPPAPQNNPPSGQPQNQQPYPSYPTPAHPQTSVHTPQAYNPGGGIMQTAKLGMWGLILTGVGIIVSILQLPFGGLFSLAGLIVAIISLVKKETPKWPAWVTIGLAIAGLLVALFLILAAIALIGGLATMAS